MSRWIDADALINALEYDIAIDEDILNYVGTEGIQRTTTQFDKDCKQNAIELLLRTPSIDLVRCGECLHHEDFPTGISPITCSLVWGGVFENDFCSYGEREESE